MRVPPQLSSARTPKVRGPRRPPTLAGVRHLPEEAAVGDPGSAVRKGQPSPGPLGVPLGRAAGEGTRGRRFPPGTAEPARGLARGRPCSRGPVPVVRSAQPPQPGRGSLPAAGAAPAPAPRLPAAPLAASPTWRPRRASRTSQHDSALLSTGSLGAGRRRETLLCRRRRRCSRLGRQAAASEPVA